MLISGTEGILLLYNTKNVRKNTVKYNSADIILILKTIGENKSISVIFFKKKDSHKVTNNEVIYQPIRTVWLFHQRPKPPRYHSITQSAASSSSATHIFPFRGAPDRGLLHHFFRCLLHLYPPRSLEHSPINFCSDLACTATSNLAYRWAGSYGFLGFCCIFHLPSLEISRNDFCSILERRHPILLTIELRIHGLLILGGFLVLLFPTRATCSTKGLCVHSHHGGIALQGRAVHGPMGCPRHRQAQRPPPTTSSSTSCPSWTHARSCRRACCLGGGATSGASCPASMLSSSTSVLEGPRAWRS